MNEKRLLIDVIPFEFVSSPLNENALSSGGLLMVKGVLQRAGAKNHNGRVYPKPVLERESNKYNENFVKQKRAVGELDHPESTVVNLKNVSHNIVEMAWNGDDLIGTVEILTTPSGNILRELLKCGVKLGISSRGFGTVKQLAENTVEVQDDFELICFDMVSNPSTVGAFMFPENALKESADVNGVKNPVTNKWKSVENIVREILNEVK